MARTSSERCCARCTPSHTTIAGVRSCTIRASSAAGVIVPTAFEARVNATTFVRSESTSANASRSRVTSSRRMSTQRTVAPASRAASTQGRMFASWSRRVTTTSSPHPRPRPTEREIASSSVVAFGPNTTSSGSACRRSAAARCAPATTESVSSLVANAPCVFALLERRYAAIASITRLGHLGSAGSVQEDGRASVVLAPQGRESLAEGGEVGHRGQASRTGGPGDNPATMRRDAP